LYHELERATCVGLTHNQVAIAMDLVAPNLEAVPEDFRGFVDANPMSGELLFIELERNASGIEGMPLDHAFAPASVNSAMGDLDVSSMNTSAENRQHSY
jgi:hypothetical protein